MKKMSKFDINVKGFILMFDELVVICKKICFVVIDLIGVIEYNKEEKFGIINLLNIYFVVIG